MDGRMKESLDKGPLWSENIHSMAIAVIAAAVFAFFIFPRRRTSNALPSPLWGGLPSFLGSMGGHTLLLDWSRITAFLEHWAREYGVGKPFTLNVTGNPTVVVTDVVEVRRILNLRPSVFARPADLAETGAVVGVYPFLFFEEGKSWGRVRRLTAPSFSERNTERMLPDVARIADRLVVKWGSAADSGAVVHALDDLSRLTHNIIALVAFRFDTHSLGPYGDSAAAGAAEMDTYEAISNIMPMMQALIYNPLSKLSYDWLPFLPWWRRHRCLQAKLDSLISASIDTERREQAAAAAAGKDAPDGEVGTKKNGSGGSGDSGMESYLLRTMVAALDTAGEGAAAERVVRAKLSDREILYNTKGFFVAGTDTTSVTLAWSMYLLATHPDKQAAARREVDAVLPNGRVESADQLKRLRYCESVVREALRLHGPANTLFLSSVVETEVCGATYPPGSWFWVMLRLAAVQEENFTRPFDFVPERWLGPEERAAALSDSEGGGVGDDDAIAHNPDVVLAFGCGPRVCPGRQLAMMEAVATVATVVAALVVGLAPDHGPPGEVDDFATRPGKVDLVFKRHW